MSEQDPAVNRGSVERKVLQDNCDEHRRTAIAAGRFRVMHPATGLTMPIQAFNDEVDLRKAVMSHRNPEFWTAVVGTIEQQPEAPAELVAVHHNGLTRFVEVASAKTAFPVPTQIAA